MDAVELTARREALGLAAGDLARLLQWEADAVVRCESGGLGIPIEVDQKLDELEFARDTIAGVLEDTLPADLPTFATDEAFWAAWPQMRGVPVRIHRIAAADTLRSAKWAGIPARIVLAGPANADRQRTAP